MGGAFEPHMEREHADRLEDPNYLLGLNVTKTNSSEGSSVAPASHDSFTIKFNAENPWQEILSSSSRQKRSMDAMRVEDVMRGHKNEPYYYSGTVIYEFYFIHIPKVILKPFSIIIGQIRLL